ncbi:MAG: ABC transporter permease [Dehalococcoidia bacterium]
MAQTTTAVELPGTGDYRKSMSDRPMVVRWLLNFWRFMITKPLGGFGVVVIALVVLAAVLAPWASRYDSERIFVAVNPCYNEELARQALTDVSVRLQHPACTFQTGQVPILNASPSWNHWLGTDGLGHDLYSRIIYGSQTALIVGLGASLLAVGLGTILGLASAYFGGSVDFFIQRIVDAFQAFPALVLLLLFGQVVANPSLEVNTVALGIVGIASVIRIVRSSVLATREEVYVTAARTVGASDQRIMGRHILPNVFAPIIVVFTNTIGLYILAEATLAFLGLGDPTKPSWGKMIEEGRRLGPAEPLMALFVGSALTATVLGFNLAGDALRDVLDPRLRGGSGRPGF